MPFFDPLNNTKYMKERDAWRTNDKSYYYENCHSWTFAREHKVWINDPMLIVIDDYCEISREEALKNGASVVYFDKNGKAIHSGVLSPGVNGSDPTIKSKLGYTPIFDGPENATDAYYKDHSKYVYKRYYRLQ